MPIRNIIVTCAAITTTLALPACAVSTQNSQPIFISSDDSLPMAIDRISWDGHHVSINGPVHITAEYVDRTNEVLRVTVSGAISNMILLQSRRFPDLDMYSFEVRATSDTASPAIIVRQLYGPERLDCAADHDGRNQLAIYFYAVEETEVYETVWEHCDPQIRILDQESLEVSIVGN